MREINSTNEATDNQFTTSRRRALKTISIAALGGIPVVSSSAAAQPTDITGIYLSNAGGRYYIHQTDSGQTTDVMWFGERQRGDDSTCGPLTWANVFSGTREGSRIKGQFYDVPKGRTSNNGSVELRVEPDGSLTRTALDAPAGFPSSWTQTGGVPAALVGFRQAGYASTAEADLTGVWTCNDGGTYYVHQVSDPVADSIAWVGEQPNKFCNVFVGTVTGVPGNKKIRGRWMDVPKYGLLSTGGELTLRVLEDNAFIKQQQTGRYFSGSRWGRIAMNCLDD